MENPSITMNGYDWSKASPEPSAPGLPTPTYCSGPMPGHTPPPPNPGNVNIMNYPFTKPQHPGSYPQHYVGYAQSHNMVVTSQPTVTVAPLHDHAKDYLAYSIFNMLCCCLFLGIAAFVFSLKTREANEYGDINKARAHSGTARTLNHVALGIGLAFFLAWVTYVIYINVTAQRYINSSYENYYG